MTDSDQTHDSEDGLSEDVAHRLIARAIELDTRRAEAVSVTQLREVAQESGISFRAFEEALREALALAEAGSVPRPPHVWERIWHLARRGSRHAPLPVVSIPASGQWPTQSIVDRFAMNTIAFGAFWAAALILGRAGSAMTTTWIGQSGGILVGNFLGLAIARRLNARAISFVLAVTACAQTAEFVLHLRYGIGSVQSGPTHWAVILASVLGVVTGLIATRRGGSVASEHVRNPVVAAEPVPMSASSIDQRARAALQLRLA